MGQPSSDSPLPKPALSRPYPERRPFQSAHLKASVRRGSHTILASLSRGPGLVTQMQPPLMPLALLAIVLVEGAEPSTVLAGTGKATTSGGSQQVSDAFDPYAEHSSRLICESEHVERVEIGGLHTNLIMRHLPDEARFDARRATFEVDARRIRSAGLTLNGGKNLCWIGGEIASRGARRVAAFRGRPWHP